VTAAEQPADMLRRRGDHPAVVMAGSATTLTYAQLDDRSTRLARVFDEAGLEPGDHVALMLANRPEFFVVLWAALRAGLYLTPINWHLGPEEAGYVLADCGAKGFVTSVELTEVTAALGDALADVVVRLVVGGTTTDVDDFDDFDVPHQ
jgi:long-chain acyl-CoA synthetase